MREKMFLSCSLQWCAFNFFVAITFLQIYVNAHIMCDHPVFRRREYASVTE